MIENKRGFAHGHILVAEANTLCIPYDFLSEHKDSLLHVLVHVAR